MRMMKVDDETYENICKLAENNHVSRADLISEAVAAKVEYEQWKVKEVRKGLADIEAGRLVSGEEMETFAKDLVKRYK